MPELEEEDSPNLSEALTRVVGWATKYRWWIILPFFAITLITIGVSFLLPNRYTSSATLLIVQQQVPQRYVVPNSTTDVTSALEAMKQEILSRPQLLRMIDDFRLYPKQKKRLAPEELIALMLSNIDIAAMNQNPQQKDIDALRISFTTENAVLAQQVTNTLTSLFINEYLRTGAEQSSNTTNFLHQQVEEKGRELQAQEERLRDFKLRFVGELPEQQPGNLGILTGLQGQLQSTMASLNRAQQQRPLLQAQLDATPRHRTVSETGLPRTDTQDGPSGLTPLDTAQSDLAKLQATRTNLLQVKGYTSVHPDVKANAREIAQAEEKVKRLMAMTPPAHEKARSTTPASSTPATTVQPTDDPVIAQLKANLESNRLEIENLTNEEKRLKSEIANYAGRINQTPVREQQQASILRDTEVLRQQYGELQKKEQESQLATNLEKQQGGQQFRLIEPASLASVPSSPKRLKMSLGGAAGGFCLGLLLAFFMEMRDTSFRTEKEIAKHLELPFVLGIPPLPTAKEERRRRRSNRFEWAIATVMMTIVMAAEYYVYRRG